MSRNDPGTAEAHTSPQHPRPLVLGVAGAIGAGKSAATRCLAELGWLVIDFDTEARAALDRPGVRRKLIEWWGIDLIAPSGLVDRSAVARVIFHDDDARKRLERLVHPLIWRTKDQAREAARLAGTPGIVLDAPLLYEAGLDASCDAVVFIDAPDPLRLERVLARGWSAEELARRERAQIPAEEKRRRAGYSLVNDGSLEELCRQMARMVAILGGHAEPSAGQ